jgi:pSer/pThr/pTyr-binding forkhead associated (FHA) protein
MKKINIIRLGSIGFLTVFLLAGIVPWILYAQTPSPELIVDICTTPHKYWNKYVMIKGHVRSVTANPPGTNRGSYVLRDSSDMDITVLTSDLPSQGKDYSVSGNVEQTSPDSKVPVIREFRRTSGSEPLPSQATRPRRVAPSDEAGYEASPARRHEAAQPAPAPAAQPAPPPSKEVQPIVVQTAPPAESSGMSATLMMGLVGLVALIVIVIVVIIMRPKKPAPAPATYARPVTSSTSAPSPIRPPAPPPPTSSRTVNAPPPRPSSAATQVVPPPAAKGTEIYFDLGMELSVTDGPDRGKRFPLTKSTITIGRSGSRQNEITLSDSTVSREHAKVIYAAAEKTFRLINESTTNPARLNGNPIDAAVIKDGDTIQVGSTIMKFSKKG